MTPSRTLTRPLKTSKAFGLRMASIVEASTDARERPKPEWRARKDRYLSHIRSPETSLGVLIVSRADNLHNARAVLEDYRDDGDRL